MFTRLILSISCLVFVSTQGRFICKAIKLIEGVCCSGSDPEEIDLNKIFDSFDLDGSGRSMQFPLSHETKCLTNCT